MYCKSQVLSHKFKKSTLATAITLALSTFSSPAFSVINPSDIISAVDGSLGDQYGWAVDVDGNTAIVGSYLDDDGATADAGSVYIYTNDGVGNWSFQQKITAQGYYPDNTNQPDDADTDLDLVDEPQRDSWFGYSVAISGDIAVIGTPFYDKPNEDVLEPDIIDTGAVYIYERNAGVWTLSAKFTIEDAKASNGDWFGNAVDIDKNTIAVGSLLQNQGASGGVYILHKDTDNTWTAPLAQNANTTLGIEEQRTLMPLDPAKEDWFGQSVAISGNTIVVGSDGSDETETGSGSVYVFTKDANSNWNMQSKILPSDPTILANFGIAVDVHNNQLVVGADGADGTVIGDSSGSAYIYSRNFAGAWTQSAKLVASDAASDDRFGRSVSIYEPLVVVGAWNENSNGTQSGSAYLFQKNTANTWTEVDVIRDATGTAFDNFGFSVAISSIDGLSDYWLVSGAPQILSGNGELQISANIANLIDTDNDGTMNDVSTDHDGDGIPNVNDLFPYDAPAFSDIDQDGFDDSVDQFPNNSTESADTDGDGLGNNADLDDDGDGLSDEDEFRFGLDPLVAENADLYLDDDGDGVVNASDAFPNDAAEFEDTDGDGTGDNADADDDNDGLSDYEEIGLFRVYDVDIETDPKNADTDDDGVNDGIDKFPLNPLEAVDTDGDCKFPFIRVKSGNGCGDKSDPDIDGDGVLNASDQFPFDPERALDTDADGIDNKIDKDNDNDGVFDINDDLPFDATETIDTDADGIGNNADTDDDNDGVLDTADLFPLDATETIDTDADGIGNTADLDDDGDGIADTREIVNGTNPLSADTDGDGATDTDFFVVAANIPAALDLFPLNPNESSDSDNDCTHYNLVTSGDGCGDNSDPNTIGVDSDSDGVIDSVDAFPNDPNESIDSDGDGIGNNADTDDDNDGVLDAADTTPQGTAPSSSSSGGGSFSASFLFMTLLMGFIRRYFIK